MGGKVEPKETTVMHTASNDSISNVCPACSSTKCRTAFDMKTYKVIACVNCGLHFVDVPYDETSIIDSDYYWAEDTYNDEVAEIRRWCNAELDKIEKLILPGKMLDVGCSFGYMLEVAHSRGWKVRGVEISKKVYEKYLGDKAKTLNVFNGRLDDAKYDSEFFDLVTMFDIIEHLADPASTVCEAGRVLRTGGYIVIETPRQESLFKRTAHFLYRITGGRASSLIRGAYNPHPGGHRLGFTKRSLELLLNKYGMEPVKYEKRMMPLNMFYRTALRNKGSFFKRYGFICASLALWWLSVILRMQNRIVVYAKKTEHIVGR